MLSKKIYATLATAGFLLGSLGAFSTDSPSASDKTYLPTVFEDVSDNDWFSPYVKYLSENAIVNGMTPTQFVPQGTFTVAESAAVITRYLGLESEAEERRRAMLTLGVPGAEEWFSGYVQLMYEAGIIDVEKFGCTVVGSSVSIVEPDKLRQPVKRCEFATFVMRSFETDGTQFTVDKNFITGGEYDEAKLSLYIPYIGDYADIPTGYDYYVLKAYHNGIFEGDNLGNFNPNNNLTRAEMAKVTATVIDSGLRTYIDVSEGSNVLGDDSYVIKKGSKLLKNEASEQILLAEAGGISLVNGMVGYTPVNKIPSGYSVAVRHYTSVGDYDKELACVASSAYNASVSAGDTLFLILTDTVTGEAVDAYQIKFLSDGITQNEFCRYNP